MKKVVTRSKRTCALFLAILMVFSTVLANPPMAAWAASEDGFVEVPVPNGDFESGETGWTFEGECSEDMVAYYWRIFKSSSGQEPNTTNMYEVSSKKGTTVTKSYRISQTLENLAPGTYKASVEGSGGNDPGTYTAVLSAGDASVSITPKQWANWITYETDTFEVTDGTLTIALDATVTGNYLNIDNVKLYKLDDTPKEVESIQPSSAKVRVGGTLNAPGQVTVLYTDGSTGKAAVTWNEEDLQAVDTLEAGDYTVRGTAVVGEQEYDAILTVTVVSAEGAIQEVPEDAQGAVDFNENWQFYLATRNPEVNGSFATGGLKDAGEYTTEEIVAPDFNDADWRTVDVPHDFSIEGEKVSSSSDAQAYLEGGLAYYRKTFTIPESMRESKKITIDFEGVYQNSVVYLNGKEIGNYPSGYTGFAYDITEDLNYGGENVLVVKVQNMSPSGRWYTGSGIIRPVHLTVDNLARFNRNGITLQTPSLEESYTANQSAGLKVSAKGYSDAGNANVYLKTTVLDADGNEVASHSTDAIATNPSTAFELTDDLEVENVNLWYPWNLGTPYLYTVRTQLYLQENGGSMEYLLMDTEETEYGFRWVEVKETTEDPNSGGLYVNGQYTKVQGVDLHHDSGALGAAGFTDAYERQFSKLKDMGVNAYRTSHCPPSKQAIEVCRRMGILVVEEAFDGWGRTKATYDFGQFFMTEVPQDWAGLTANGLNAVPRPGIDYSGAVYTWSDWVIQEMINRDKNEPSIIAWSIGNEVRGVGSQPSWYDVSKYDLLGVSPSGINEYTEAVRLLADVDAADGTRYVLMGGDQERSVPASGSTWGLVNQVLDGYGLNYNTAASVDGLINRFSIGDGTLNENGTKTFFFESESSSQTSSRGVYLDADLSNTGINETPGSRGGSNYDNDFASWTMSNEYGLKKDRDRKSFIGQFIWTGFDYLGEPTPYSVYPVGVASFGTIDTAGFPKDSFYLYQSQWVTEPMVHLLPTNWDQWREGEEVDVWVNTNVQSAELFLNGESLGVKSFDKKTTAYGKDYYETSESTADDKTWGDSSNPGGYTSRGAVVEEGSTNYGKLHLSWKVPYEPGTLEVKAYGEDGQVVATDRVTTSKTPYTIQAEADKTVLQADGSSLSYVECTIVDQDGNMVADADNLVTFDVEGAAKIVGVDNGQQESTELYKYGNLDKNSHSERSAYHGKVLVILQAEKEAGDVTLTIGSEYLKTAQVALKVTEDGTGEEPVQPTVEGRFVSVEPVELTVPQDTEVTLPGTVVVHYDGGAAGAYCLVQQVTWEEAASPEGIVEGTVDGISEKATARITVDESMETDVNLAANTALGAGNATFTFEGLQESSPLRQGALATASFTGSKSNYPNNMLDGSQDTSWTNAYTRGASVLLPANSASRKSEYVEFFWDEAKVFNQVSLSFVRSSKCEIPSVLEVQYWDGDQWIAVKKQTTLKAEETKEATVMRFDAVYTDRVRVYMENATPYSARGNIEITEAGVEFSTKKPTVQLQLTAQQEKVEWGQSLDITGSLTARAQETRIKTLTFAVDYDSEVFDTPSVSLVDGADGTISGALADGKYIVTYENAQGLAADITDILKLSIPVKETAPVGTFTIGLSDLAASDTEGEEVPMAGTNISVQVGAEGETYLSDLPWVSATSGWESVEIDKNCNGADSSGIALKIDGQKAEFEKGLGVCADSEIVYDISSFTSGLEEGEFLHFQSWIGIDYFKVEGNRNGDGVYFIVYGDGEELYRSSLLDTNSDAAFVDVDVTGVRELKLYVDKNETNSHDNADWADAKLVKQSLRLSETSIALDPGEGRTLTATVSPADLAGEAVWNTSDSSVAEVTESMQDGKTAAVITAKAPGTAVITLTAGGNTVSCEVTVNKILPREIALNTAEYTMPVGGSYALSATFLPANTTEKNIEWVSSNTEVVSVNDEGQITGLKPGVAAVTAVTVNGRTASCVVTVKADAPQEKPITGIALSAAEMTLRVQESGQLNAKVLPEDSTQNVTLVYLSSDDQVASVDAKGLISAKAEGTAVITVISLVNGSVTAQCRVTVLPVTAVVPASFLSLEAAMTLDIGGKATRKATVLPENTTYKTVTYTSSDPKVAEVNQNGTVTAKKAGAARITASCGNASASYDVYVRPARVGITSFVSKKKKTALVKWKKVAGADGYIIQVSTKGKTSGFKQVANVKKAGTVKYTLKKGLKAGRKAYVRIQAYYKSAGTTVKGKFSKVKAVKIK